jgi:hypothetical protein
VGGGIFDDDTARDFIGELAGSKKPLDMMKRVLEDAPGSTANNTRERNRMRRTRLFCAIGVSLWSAVLAGSQGAAPASLSAELRAHVKDERFGIVTSIRGLPLGVRDGLQMLFGTRTLDIAEPGAEFQVTDVIVKPGLPTRRLVTAGCSIDHCLVYYERGGIAHTWQAALFHWTPAATRFEWGGIAPGSLKTIDDVRNAVVSGAIKAAVRFW